MEQESIYLCIEKMGTQFESITNFNVPMPRSDSDARLMLDWSAMTANLIVADRSTEIKVAVIAAFAGLHQIEVIRLDSDEFYRKFPGSDPRNNR